MTLATRPVPPQIQRQQQQRRLNVTLLRQGGGYAGRRRLRINTFQQHSLPYYILSILLCLCCLPDYIVALKDVSVTIPQAVKRGSNAMLTCNYDMENDTLYSVKWYKGRREFYRYTPKENPAMKVFPSQSGLNVERNLSNQSHVVLLAVPLNISGKFTCEISVEAPSFQTAMVSGEMEVVELPEEQATVTGIQPRYRIGDLVDGNCSIKYSKPAANLTWTINGIVVAPHHIKTYQIEKYEETNLESIMSAVHFMVTTQHFIKGQMRLKCTASIFDIFKEEIESIIEEDRPRIMASGQSYPSDNGYGTHTDSEGYEHNESYLTYFSAPKSSASPSAEFVISKIFKVLKQQVLRHIQALTTLIEAHTQRLLKRTTTNDLVICIICASTFCKMLQLILMRVTRTAFVTSSLVILQQLLQRNLPAKTIGHEMPNDWEMACNCIEIIRQMIEKHKEGGVLAWAINLCHKTQYRIEKDHFYQDANDNDCQSKCGQRQQYLQEKLCVAANQNVVNENLSPSDTNINTTNKNASKESIAAIPTGSDCQHQVSQTFAFAILPPTPCAVIHLPTSSLLATASIASALPSSLSSSGTCTLRHVKKDAHDSFPLCAAVDASKSNNAKYVSKDQTLLMTFAATAASSNAVTMAGAPPRQSAVNPRSAFASTASQPKLLLTCEHNALANVNSSSHPSSIFSGNIYLITFIGELLLHHC